jgi:hypothetical protein
MEAIKFSDQETRRNSVGRGIANACASVVIDPLLLSVPELMQAFALRKNNVDSGKCGF